MARIEPLEPPYEPDVAEQLARMMPAGVPPITLFRTFARNLPMAEAMGGWGRYELGRALSLGRRHREIVIDRVCARCGCEYEWGVHVAFFAGSVGLTEAQVASIVTGDSADSCWLEERDRVLLDAVDALHDAADIDDALWARLAAVFDDRQLLDLLLLAGWYHAISFAARVSRIPLEQGAPTFASALDAATRT